MDGSGSDRRDQGIAAVNPEFREQAYHLSEQEGAEAFDEEFEIRTCDMGPLFRGRPRGASAAGRARVSFPMALEVLPGLGAAKYDPIRAEQFHTRITSKYYGDDYASG